MASSSTRTTAHTDGVEFLFPNEDNVVANWEVPTTSSSSFSSSPSSFSLSTAAAAAAAVATRRGNNAENHQNLSLQSVDNLVVKHEQQRLEQSSSFFNNVVISRGGTTKDHRQHHVQVSALSLQKYQDFILSSFSYYALNDEDINKHELPASRKKLSPVISSEEQENTRGKFNNESISSSSSSAQNYSSSFSSLFEDINYDTNLDENDKDDSSVLSEKSVTSNIFDEEESIGVLDCTKKQTFSSSPTTPFTNNSRTTTNINIKGRTSFIGQQEGNEMEEQQQEDLNNRTIEDEMVDVLDSVTMVLDGTTEDDFINFTKNSASNINHNSQEGVYSHDNMTLSSTLLLEPTPICMDPNRIQVVPTIVSSPAAAAAARQGEGPPQPAILSKNWCSLSNTTTSSKGSLLWNGHDHDRDIRDHVIKVLLNQQAQNLSSPPRHNQEKYEDEAPQAVHQITDDDLRSCQKHGCSSAFTSKKRSFSGECWGGQDNKKKENSDSWFTTIDGNSTLLPCSKMEEHTANEGIFAQPSPSRKKSRTDDDSYIGALFQPKYLENENQGDGTNAANESNNNRFRTYQAEQWWQRLQDMIDFQKMHGHCNVPNTFPENPILAQWVKRQRYQYKLKQEGKHSTLTDEREAILQNMGFIWDSHGALWAERWNELKEFYDKVGHSNVPTHYEKNRHLAIWVKCQRRQYKLFIAGDPKSNMTVDRIRKLELLGFVWHPKVGAKSAKEKEQYIIL